ncbi:winged helix-turn-helix domain-containing protein [Coralloluteibacterium stylophorae]|uniref:LysR family transcriptional regulator n=1 Tax=Coralloluteibacterium stylophorae TaxID=1776034 RepID=A0A8J8AZT2_9GAMM|nr:LysR family transcriptional regulator [Coralloluteibacterium stylophorae]MBS7458378.1 LysR family transcriptional regulator [Coralloluteibacterium stylophorae]
MSAPRIKLRLVLDDDLVLGPGKADLLDAIARTGSISAAGRELGMSYRRAWALIEAMNAGFATAVVETATGGRGGGGARLTATGAELLRLYRRMLDRCTAAAGDEIAAIARLRCIA